MSRLPFMCGMLLLLALAGCVHAISEENRKMTTGSPPFESIVENPKNYSGKIVMLGGKIQGVRNAEDGGQLEIIQYPLSEEGYPEEGRGSGGRFFATSPTFLDEAFYTRDSLVTIVGEVKGARKSSLDGLTSSYPVISIRESHVWQSDEKQEKPFQIPGTDKIDPYYSGHGLPMPMRPQGTVLRPY